MQWLPRGQTALFVSLIIAFWGSGSGWMDAFGVGALVWCTDGLAEAQLETRVPRDQVVDTPAQNEGDQSQE